MKKENVWRIDTKRHGLVLFWDGVISKETGNVEDNLKTLDIILKAIEKQPNIQILSGIIGFVSKDKEGKITNKFSIDFSNADEIKTQLKNKPADIRASDCYIKLKVLAKVYDDQGEIIDKWIDEPLKIMLSNEENEGLSIDLFSYTDLWLPDTWYGKKEKTPDNMELARLNLPILNNLLQDLIAGLGIKFKLNHELSPTNQAALILKDDEIAIKNG